MNKLRRESERMVAMMEALPRGMQRAASPTTSQAPPAPAAPLPWHEDRRELLRMWHWLLTRGIGTNSVEALVELLESPIAFSEERETMVREEGRVTFE